MAVGSTDDEKGVCKVEEEGEMDEFTKQEMEKNKKGDSKIDHILDKVCQFTLMDVIEDHCRVRFVNVWAFLLVYIFFVISGLHLAPAIKPVLKDVRFVSSPASSIVFAKKEGITRTPKALLQHDTGAPAKDSMVYPEIVEFRAAIQAVPCGTYQRRELNGTLEALRTVEVCEMNISGNGTADVNGLAAIPDFDISGPAGIYTLRVGSVSTTDGHAIPSETEFKSSLRTEAQTLEVLHPSTLQRLPAPRYCQQGVNLPTQPVVRVSDQNGLPVSGVAVTVFVNPDPFWPPQTVATQTPHYNRRGQKLTELECARSEPSDANGLARFTCLKVVSSTYWKMNFVFTMNSMLFYPWNDPAFSYFDLYPVELRLNRYATEYWVDVDHVEVLEGPPATIREGTMLPEMRVRALNSQGQPVAGVQCFVLIASENGMRLPMLFRRQLTGQRRKQLLNPKSNKTDSDGIARFTNVNISGYGNVIDTMSRLRGGDPAKADPITGHGERLLPNQADAKWCRERQGFRAAHRPIRSY